MLILFVAYKIYSRLLSVWKRATPNGYNSIPCFSAIVLQREIVNVSSFCFQTQQSSSETGSTLKGKNLLLKSKFLSVRVDPNLEGRQK